MTLLLASIGQFLSFVVGDTSILRLLDIATEHQLAVRDNACLYIINYSYWLIYSSPVLLLFFNAAKFILQKICNSTGAWPFGWIMSPTPIHCLEQ